MMDQTIQDSSNSTGFNSNSVRMTDLAQHLRLADNHRIERRRYPKQVPHSLFIRVAIEMCLEKTRR
jgi:hypothetical protein